MKEDLLRIRNRAARLVKLVDLEAPDIIVLRECQLVGQAAEMLDPEQWRKLSEERAEVLRRREAGLCEHCEGDETFGPRPAVDAGMCRICLTDVDEIANMS